MTRHHSITAVEVTEATEAGAMHARADRTRDDDGGAWPRWWRISVIAAATLIMCSCQSSQLAKHAQHAAQHGPGGHGPGDSVAGYGGPDNGLAAGGPAACASCPTGGHRRAEERGGLRERGAGQLASCPAGAGCPSDGSCVVCAAHPDEYLCDGGDRNVGVAVYNSGEIAGLDQEDTVAHYVTVDGRRVVQPSSKVCIYAPRFAAVRKVQAAFADEQVLQPIGIGQPLQLAGAIETSGATGSTQNIALGRHFGSNKTQGYNTTISDGALSRVIGPVGFDNAFMPYEDLAIIRTGKLDHRESARLIEAATAAITWTHEQAVQIVVDEQAAAEAVRDEQVEVMFTVDNPAGPANIRVIKIASTDAALPGDIIDFTIRLDNLGGKPVSNVTLVDNLTTRLEYVEDSAQSSLEAKFMTEENDGGSLILRWDFGEPLVARDGGLVRFKCRVR